MIVYQHNKREFINECNSKAIASIVSENMRTKGISYFDKSQIDAWKHSLPAITNVLEKSDTDDDIDVAIEYKFNQSKDRIDFLIYGKDENDKDNVVIIKLKQWSSVSSTNKPIFVHTFSGAGEKGYRHPSYQAINYANILYNFNEYLQKNSTSLSSRSYLHNMGNGNFKAKLNIRNSDVGSDYSWLNDPQSINEVGCIHTCQGLDMNYCEVIIGKNLML